MHALLIAHLLVLHSARQYVWQHVCSIGCISACLQVCSIVRLFCSLFCTLFCISICLIICLLVCLLCRPSVNLLICRSVVLPAGSDLFCSSVYSAAHSVAPSLVCPVARGPARLCIRLSIWSSAVLLLSAGRVFSLFICSLLLSADCGSICLFFFFFFCLLVHLLV
jgi:hypothetical protein